MKILILSASVGSGHGRAAEALAAAARELSPEASVKVVDVLELAGPAFRAVYRDAYFALASKAPNVLATLYDALDRPLGSLPLGESARRLLQRLCLRDFPDLLKREAPDAVVCAHFLPAELAVRLKETRKLRAPLAVVVTDFDAHRLWAQPRCDRYFVAARETAATLLGWGVGRASIEVTGIPIDPRFGRMSRADARAALGVDDGRPVVLQLAGGSGVGPLDRVFSGILEVSPPVHVVAVAGRNEYARRRLSARRIPGRHRATILGYTDRLHEYMAAADLIVTKPGGLTTSEALACGVPLVMIDPIPGQETRNSDFVLENGAGVKVNSLATLSVKLEALLQDEPRLMNLRLRARALGSPVASYAVARSVLAMAENALAASSARKTADQRPSPAGQISA